MARGLRGRPKDPRPRAVRVGSSWAAQAGAPFCLATSGSENRIDAPHTSSAKATAPWGCWRVASGIGQRPRFVEHSTHSGLWYRSRTAPWGPVMLEEIEPVRSLPGRAQSPDAFRQRGVPRTPSRGSRRLRTARLAGTARRPTWSRPLLGWAAARAWPDPPTRRRPRMTTGRTR